MNIDNLISKYLDGELSEKEDLKLRNMISSDEKTRDMFNTYVDLHLATKEDADSINTPFELFSDTEDKVLMTIMSANATPLKNKRAFNIFQIFPKQLATMVAVLLLICFTYTYDTHIFNHRTPNYTKSPMAMNVPTVVPNAVASSAKTVVNLSNNNGNLTSDAGKIDNKSEISFVESKVSEPESSQSNLLSSSSDLHSSLAINNNSSDSDSNKRIQDLENLGETVSVPTISIMGSSTSNSTTEQFGDISNRVRPNQNSIAINNIELSAFSSRPYTVLGFDDKANASLNSYSQAISLSINDKTDIGLEIGFSDISYTGEVFTTTNVLDKYGRETGQQLVFRTEKEKEYALYWGQVFFQTELYSINKFDLGVRFGLGMSSDGFNSSSKLIASYELASGIKLITGSEFNFFNASLPQLVNAGTSNYYSFSMVYGLQFSF
jgi:hypothetical protein